MSYAAAIKHKPPTPQPPNPPAASTSEIISLDYDDDPASSPPPQHTLLPPTNNSGIVRRGSSHAPSASFSGLSSTSSRYSTSNTGGAALSRTLGGGGSFRHKDNWRRAVGTVHGDPEKEEEADVVVEFEEHQDERNGGGLHRQSSLPTRHSLQHSSSLTRRTANQKARNPSISSVSGVPLSFRQSLADEQERLGEIGGSAVGRSSSLRGALSGGKSGGWREGDEIIPHHHRSYSASSPMPPQDRFPFHDPSLPDPRAVTPPVGAQGGATGLTKSSSVRSTSNSVIGGHSHTRSMFSFRPNSPPPLSSTAALPPVSLANWDGYPGGASPSLGQKTPTQADMDKDGEGGVKRVQSLNYGYGSSTRVQDRLARSPALFPPEARRERERELERDNMAPPTSPIRKSPWDAASLPGEDGWSAAGTGASTLSRQNSERDTPGGDAQQKDKLRAAFEAMQLGTSTGNPAAVPATPSAANPAHQLLYQMAMEDSPPPAFGLARRLGNDERETELDRYTTLGQQRSPEKHQYPDMTTTLGLGGYGQTSLLGGLDPLGIRPGEASWLNGMGGNLFGPSLGVGGVDAGLFGATGNVFAAPGQGSLGLGMGGLHTASFQLGAAAALAQYQQQQHLQQQAQQHAGFMQQRYHADQSSMRGPNPNQHQQPLYPSNNQNRGYPYHQQQQGPPPPQQQQQPDPRSLAKIAIPDDVAQKAAEEVRIMVESRGLNPIVFDCSPPNAKFFVIKSFTEDDVHKSLKHEIWSSTTFGNQRLNKAFQEASGRPVYLFFSVNGSGHFCGVAQMTTPVDYNKTSNVWAQDKWKGIFEVRWIFVRDVPNGALRHIRLLNTQEQKPITNSRDTQELLPEAGSTLLKIFSTYKERTSLLEDFGFYELQEREKAANQKDAPPKPNRIPTPTPPSQLSDMGPPPIPVARVPPQSGFVKGFSPSGPPSLGNSRFQVVGGYDNSGRGGLRGGQNTR